MKVPFCRLCQEALVDIGTDPVTCSCGNISGWYWKDREHFTLLVLHGEESASLYGYDTRWWHLKNWESILKETSPIRYYLTYPWRAIFKLWMYARLNGRIVWHKPFAQAMYHTKLSRGEGYVWD